MDARGTYVVFGLRCGNCTWRQSGQERLLIPKGQTVAQTPCPNCGCKTLARPL